MSLDPSTSTATTTAQERQPVRSWPRALPAVFQYATMTTPWATLLAGCLIGTGILWLLRYVADTSRSSVDQNTMRFTVLPAVAGLAFVPRAAFRPLVDATPVPAWLAPVAQTALAFPALALTCWLQLLLIHPNGPPGPIAHPPAIYPLLAQLTGWCALTLAIAVCTERSKYADLGGAVAAPAGLTLIALATYSPGISHLLATPPAGPRSATAAWYSIAAAAFLLASVAMRDRWHRYTRSLSGWGRRVSA